MSNDVNVKIDKSLLKPIDALIQSPKNKNRFGSKVLKSRKDVVTKAVEVFLTEAEKPNEVASRKLEEVTA